MNARFCDDQVLLQIQIRELENAYPIQHAELENWARWSRGRNEDCPILARPALWDMPGDHDPDLDPDAVPESPPIPVFERSAIKLDTRINKLTFPALWARIVKANYLPPKGCLYVAPEWQRPRNARVSSDSYLIQLRYIYEGLQR